MELPTKLRRGPAWLQDSINELRDFMGKMRILRGENYEVHEAPDGVVLFFETGGTGGTPGAKAGPWAIVGGSDAKSVKVANATLLGGPSLTSQIAITGIGDDQQLTAGQFLFLQITYTAGAVTSVALVADDRWAEYPTPYTLGGAGTLGDPYVINKAYFLVGYASDPAAAVAAEGPVITLEDKTNLKIVRCNFTPLEMMLTNVGGGFIAPFPQASTRNGPA